MSFSSLAAAHSVISFILSILLLAHEVPRIADDLAGCGPLGQGL